jgi:hypothetical protein
VYRGSTENDPETEKNPSSSVGEAKLTFNDEETPTEDGKASSSLSGRSASEVTAQKHREALAHPDTVHVLVCSHGGSLKRFADHCNGRCGIAVNCSISKFVCEVTADKGELSGAWSVLDFSNADHLDSI